MVEVPELKTEIPYTVTLADEIFTPRERDILPAKRTKNYTELPAYELLVVGDQLSSLPHDSQIDSEECDRYIIVCGKTVHRQTPRVVAASVCAILFFIGFYVFVETFWKDGSWWRGVTLGEG